MTFREQKKTNMKLLMLIPVLLCGCSWPANPDDQEVGKPQTKYGYGKLITIEHDNHKFVVISGTQKAAILHHPSCPCQTK